MLVKRSVADQVDQILHLGLNVQFEVGKTSGVAKVTKVTQREPAVVLPDFAVSEEET